MQRNWWSVAKLKLAAAVMAAACICGWELFSFKVELFSSGCCCLWCFSNIEGCDKSETRKKKEEKRKEIGIPPKIFLASSFLPSHPVVCHFSSRRRKRQFIADGFSARAPHNSRRCWMMGWETGESQRRADCSTITLLSPPSAFHRSFHPIRVLFTAEVAQLVLVASVVVVQRSARILVVALVVGRFPPWDPSPSPHRSASLPHPHGPLDHGASESSP